MAWTTSIEMTHGMYVYVSVCCSLALCHSFSQSLSSLTLLAHMQWCMSVFVHVYNINGGAYTSHIQLGLAWPWLILDEQSHVCISLYVYLLCAPPHGCNQGGLSILTPTLHHQPRGFCLVDSDKLSIENISIHTIDIWMVNYPFEATVIFHANYWLHVTQWNYLH